VFRYASTLAILSGLDTWMFKQKRDQLLLLDHVMPISIDHLDDTVRKTDLAHCLDGVLSTTADFEI
jgi:hypothetical protein